jgi:hypothetical protein
MRWIDESDHRIGMGGKEDSLPALHDVLSKKLAAIEALLDDPDAELVYRDDNDDGARTVPFSPSSTADDDEGPSFTLGIYGSELQRPEDAADGIRTIALSHVVSSDVREVVRALDRECDLDEGYISVGVDLDIALRIVRGLKSLVEEIERRQVARVVLVLEEDVDFP